jgi:hypothetical protein
VLSSRGLQFIQPDNAPFRQALQQAGLYAEWRNKFGPEAWAQLESAVGSLA